MKKIIYILIAVLFVNCDLDLNPHDSLAPDVAYATYEDCDNAARGMYMRAVDVYGDDYYLIVADGFCDNIISFSQGRQTKTFLASWNLNSGSNFMWSEPYATIINANLLLDNMIIPEGDGAAKYNQIKGEALAIRAIMHYVLAEIHGKNPQFASASDLGVPYVKVTNSDNKPARDNVESNFEDMITDLTEAYNLMSFESVPDVSRLSKEAVAGYLAKIYLYMGKYDEAYSWAETALSQGATLCNTDNFSKVWADASDDGVMFKLVVTENDDLKIGDEFNQYLGDEYKSEFVAPKSMATLYDQDNDVRFSSYLDKSEYQGKEAYHIIKYAGIGGEKTRNKVSLKVMRVAEMKLIMAEAALRKPTINEAKANEIIKELKINRIVGFDPDSYLDLSGQALLTEVMLQRRLELFCEWDRFATIKRLGMDISRVVGETDLSDGVTGRPWAETSLSADSHKFQFPISTSEMDANPNMEQNPGY